MPIDDLYADSTNQYLSGSNQVNVPAPQTPPSTSITSIARAVGRGFGQGALQFGGALADETAGLSQFYVDPDSAAGAAMSPEAQAAQDKQINDALAKQRAGHLFESRAGAAAYDLADTLKPDPTKTTATDQIVQGAVSGLTQILPSALLFGPAGGAVAGGASIGMSRAEDMKRQGVDVGTRTAVGAVEGALGGVGAVLPVAGSTLARTAALVAVGGPGMGVAQGFAEKAILRNANYDHLADQIDPLDPTNLVASTLVAGVFAGAHVAATARGAKVTADAAAAAPKTPPIDVPITDMSVDARKALRYNAPQLDAYATQAAQAAGVPPEMLLFIKNRGEQSNSNQVSPKGAKGVMQFTPDTWAAFGKGDATDPVNSIDASAAYAKDLLQRYDGDVRAAITEYNGGVKQAQAVHAGDAPTDPETIAYLRKYDRYAATQQINSVKFNATPDQVDAALVSHGQNMVDDANILPETDVAGMAAHQDAFELAANQMSTGAFPSVADGIPADATSRAAYQAFERDVGNAVESAPAPELPASRLPDHVYVGPTGFETTPHPGKTLFHETSPEGAASIIGDDLTNFAGGHRSSNLFVTDDPALAIGQGGKGVRIEFDGAAVSARVHEKPGTGVIGGNEFKANAMARDAIDKVVVADGSDIPLKGAQRANFLHRFEKNAMPDGSVEYVRKAKAKPAEPARKVANEESGDAGRDATIDTAPGKPADETASHGTGNAGAGTPAAEGKPLSPVEANVREAAQLAPETPVHLDSSDPNATEHNGTLASALEIIDNEHAATVDDAKLFSVAANCFIATGF